MNDTENILILENVRFGYDNPKKKVINDITLKVVNKSVTAILGPNGAGKTTLLHLAMGWLIPEKGMIYWENKPIEQYSRRESGKHIGLVPQSEYIPFEYSLLDYVLLGRAPYLRPLDIPNENDCNIAIDSLRKVGMDNLSSRPITSISGGERQLVLLARSLAQQPSLLLLDEPTSHLDLANKIRLIRLIEELVNSGVSILLTTHEPEFVANVATHVLLIRDGQLLFSGLMEDALTDEWLTQTYGTEVKVARVNGKLVVLWG
jgi:iron complex transport system ATP-binding protein